MSEKTQAGRPSKGNVCCECGKPADKTCNGYSFCYQHLIAPVKRKKKGDK